MTGARHQAFADLAAAQNRLTRALLAESRNVTEIIELAECVRRLERQAAEAERGRQR
jgi:hypothetical protein